MDIEAAMMALQSNRANERETQLRAQVDSLQRHNEQIGRLNEALGSANDIKATFGAHADASTVFGAKLSPEKYEALMSSFTKEFGEAKVDVSAQLKDGLLTKGEVDALIGKTGGLISVESSGIPTDMQRLQSVKDMGSHVEQRDDRPGEKAAGFASEMMIDFVKTVQESRAGIIGKMR